MPPVSLIINLSFLSCYFIEKIRLSTIIKIKDKRYQLSYSHTTYAFTNRERIHHHARFFANWNKLKVLRLQS